MRSVEEQLSLVTASAVAPRPVRVAISEAQGLLCAEEVVATRPLPGFDQAAIDGYAVRSVDLRHAGAGGAGAEGSDAAGSAGVDAGDGVDGGAGEITLPVVGEVSAGSRQPTRLQPGQAVRVRTGAPLPTLADAVLPTGWTNGGHARVVVYQPVPSGAYVRRLGDDVQPGDIAVKAGTIIGPAQVGLLAAVGRSRVLVHPRPRIAVISVGGELVDIDRTPGVGQVLDVNSYALAAAARDAGADVSRVGIAGAEPAQFREAVESHMLRAEMIVVAGAAGGSASKRYREVLAELGDLEMMRIAMHPGSVQGYGTLGPEKVPTFLLPSNPVSALVVFEVMVRPLVRIAMGRRQPMRRTVRARAVAPITSVGGRKSFLRGRLMRDESTGEYLVEALGGASGASSHLLATLAEANCLVTIDPATTSIDTGDQVDVMFLALRG